MKSNHFWFLLLLRCGRVGCRYLTRTCMYGRLGNNVENKQRLRGTINPTFSISIN